MKTLLSSAAILLSSIACQSGWELTWTDPNPSGSVQAYKVVEIANGQTTTLAVTTNTVWAISLPPGQHLIGVVATGTNSVDSDPSTTPVAVLVSVVNLEVKFRQ